MSWCGVGAGVWPAGGWGVRLGVGGSLGPRCGGLGVRLGLVGWNQKASSIHPHLCVAIYTF